MLYLSPLPGHCLAREVGNKGLRMIWMFGARFGELLFLGWRVFEEFGHWCEFGLKCFWRKNFFA